MQILDREDPSARPAPVSPTPPEYVTIQVSPLQDGALAVSLSATVFDESDYQLIAEDLAHERVASVEEVLALIRAHLHFAAPAN